MQVAFRCQSYRLLREAKNSARHILTSTTSAVSEASRAPNASHESMAVVVATAIGPAYLLSEPWQPEEIEKWEAGHRKLAAMMGAESLSEREVGEALRYLLPTRLMAEDARPLMKVRVHPNGHHSFPNAHCSIPRRCLIREKVYTSLS